MDTVQLRQDIARWGVSRALYLRVMARLETIGLHVYWIQTRRLDRGGADLVAPPEVTIRQLDINDLRIAAADPELDISVAFAEAALTRGDLCFGAYRGAELVSYAWRSFDVAPDSEGVWVRVKPPYRYGYNAFTRVADRGRGIWPALAVASDRACLARGRAQAIAYTATHNFASLQADRKIGNRPIGLGGYFAKGAVFVPFYTPRVRRTGFRFFKAGSSGGTGSHSSAGS